MGGGGGMELPPDTSHWEISADLPGKERQGKKGKWRRKEGKSKKGKAEKLQNEEGPPPFFFSFHFSKPLKLFWVYQNGNFLPGESISRREKSGKMTLPPLKNVPLTSLFKSSLT